MAFNMKRPIIKGTALHKASIAKARKSIVTPASVGADPTLTRAGEWLGKSNIGEAIDFKIDQDQIDWSKVKGKKKKKEETEEERKKRLAEGRKKIRNDRRLSEDDANQKIYDNLSKRKGGRGLTPEEQKALDKAAKYLNLYKKEKKVKNKDYKKEGEKKDTWYRDSDDDGNWFSKDRKGSDVIKAIGGGLLYVKDKIVNTAGDIIEGTVNTAGEIVDLAGNIIGDVVRGIDKNLQQIDDTVSDVTQDLTTKLNNAKTKAEENRIKKQIIAQELKDQKEIDDALKLERENEEKLKKRLLEEKESERLKQMNRKENIIIGDFKPVAIGGEQIQQYSKEQRERLKTEGVWSDDVERNVLPEEIIDGTYVPKAKGTIVVSPEADKKLTPKEGPKEKFADANNNNIPDYLEVDNSSESVMQQRNDRIWGYAKKGDLIHKNMRKSGYIPREER